MCLSKICQIMPVNVVKTVQMGVQPVEELLSDVDLDMKVIHLVRDPRGTLLSRKTLDWCKAAVCSDPKAVCDNLVTDLGKAVQMQTKYSDR